MESPHESSGLGRLRRDPRTLPEALLLLRTQTRLTTEQAATLSGVNARTISRYESVASRQQDATTLRKLIRAYADKLGTTTDQLWAELGHALDHYMTSAEILDAQIEALGGRPPNDDE